MFDNILSTLFGKRLREKNIQLITGVLKNMKNKLMPFIDKILLRKRSIIETINDQLKNICQIEHCCYREVLKISSLILYQS